MTNNLNKKVGRATAWSSLTELMAKLVTPFTNIALARLLLPEAFGIVATITLVISFAEVFTDAGFQKYIIQHEFEDEDELNRSTNVAFWTNLSVSVLACVIILVFRNPIAKLVGNPELGIPISIASLLIILHAFSSIQMARYKRDFDFKTLFFVRMGTALIPLVITIPMAFLLRNYWALVIGNFASQIFCSVVLTWRAKWKIKFYYSIALFKEMFSFTAWTLLESISIWLTTNIDIFIISSFLSDYHLGLYKTSIATVNAYMALITVAILPVLFSALSRYQNDASLFQSTYYTFQRLTAVLVVPLGIGIFLFRDFVTMILLGENWMEASGFIGWWGLTSVFAILFSSFSSEVIRSKGKPMISLVLQLSQIAVLVPVLLIFKDYGFERLYVARSLVRFEIVVAAIGVICLKFKFNLGKIFINVLPSFLSALVMGTAGYFLLRLSDKMLWQWVWILICIVVYFAVLLGCFPSIRQEIFGIPFVQKLIGKLKKTVKDRT
mgnify:CR=1 FL=1